MIKSFKHKGLKKFFYYGDVSGIQAEHRNKLKIILTTIDTAKTLCALSVPMFHLHELKGELKRHYSIRVNGSQWKLANYFKI